MCLQGKLQLHDTVAGYLHKYIPDERMLPEEPRQDQAAEADLLAAFLLSCGDQRVEAWANTRCQGLLQRSPELVSAISDLVTDSLYSPGTSTMVKLASLAAEAAKPTVDRQLLAKKVIAETLAARGLSKAQEGKPDAIDDVLYAQMISSSSSSIDRCLEICRQAPSVVMAMSWQSNAVTLENNK